MPVNSIPLHQLIEDAIQKSKDNDTHPPVRFLGTWQLKEMVQEDQTMLEDGTWREDHDGRFSKTIEGIKFEINLIV